MFKTSRRRFLKAAMGVAAVLPFGLVEACTAVAPSSPAAGVSTAAAGSTTPKQSDLVQVAVSTALVSFDWQASGRSETTAAGTSLYEPLYAVNRDYVAVPMLAADFPRVSADQLTYTIPIRSG